MINLRTTGSMLDKSDYQSKDQSTCVDQVPIFYEIRAGNFKQKDTKREALCLTFEDRIIKEAI